MLLGFRKVLEIFVTKRVGTLELGVVTYGCQRGKVPQCLANCCTPVSDVPARQRLRSSSHHLDVPRHWLSTHGRRAFSVAGPSVWNSLLVELFHAAVVIVMLFLLGLVVLWKIKFFLSGHQHRQFQTIAKDMPVLKVQVHSAH